MKFDSSVYSVSTVSVEERKVLWGVCGVVWGSFKVSKSETGREVDVY
jgi:hypothetical protein